MRKILLFSVALFFLIANAFAVAPTVDFNWFVNGTPDINTVVFQNIIFDPKITSSPDANIMFWRFDSDGNTNYFSQGGLSYFSDDFSSGSIAGYTVNSGSWSAASNYLRGGGTDPSEIYRSGLSYGISIRDLNIHYRIYLESINANTSFGWFSKNTTARITGYDLAFAGSAGVLQKNGASLLSLSNGVGTGAFHDVNINHSTLGQITIFVDGLQVGQVTDTTYTDGNNFIIDQQATTDFIRYDDINLFSSNQIPINIDKNENHAFTSVGTKNICLTVGNNDGNTTRCRLLSIAGNVSFAVFDENTNTQLFNAKAIFNGSIINADSNGILNIPTPSTGAEFAIDIFDLNHNTRTFTFFLDTTSAIQKNVFLIDTTTARNINFLVRDQNGTKRGGNIFRIEKDGKLVSQVRLDTNAMWLIPMANLVHDYNFFVDSNTSSTSNLFSYKNTQVNVLVPLNEKDLSTISPFRIIVSDLTSIDRNSLTSTFSFNIYPNTQLPYKITIDSNSLQYFQRYYNIRTNGGITLYTLQPYMLRPIDGALTGTFVVTDSLTNASVPNFVFEFRTDVGNNANILVESPQTDSAGQFLFTTITGKNYNLTILNQFGDVVKTGLFISSTASTYFVNLFTGTISVNPPQIGNVDANIIIPETGFFYLNNSGNYGFRFQLAKTGNPVPTVSNVRVIIKQVSTTLLDTNFSPVFPTTNFVNGTRFDANFTGADQSFLVNVQIVFTTSIGTITKNFSITLRSTIQPNVSVPSFGNITSEIGSIGGIFLWLIIAIIITAALRFSPFAGVDNGGLMWILVIWTGIAGWMGIIPIIIGFIGIMGAIGLWFLGRQPLGAR